LENSVSDENDIGPKKFRDDLHDQIHRDIHESVDASAKAFASGIKRGAERYRGFRGGAIWGGVLLVIGVAFLLDNLGILPVDHLFRFWPLILIAAGVSKLMRREHRVWGISICLIGALFLLDNLGFAHFRWSQLWPLALIVGGVLLIWNSLEARRNVPTTTVGPNTLNELAIFGGIERRVTTQSFEGGQATAIFGGIEIDLRLAGMAADSAILDVNTVFGGCEVRVPETWNIVTEGQGIFGGYSDSTRQTGVEDLTNPKKKTLLIRGAAVFGGVEIKN
jgi:predicted membrane protein